MHHLISGSIWQGEWKNKGVERKNWIEESGRKENFDLFPSKLNKRKNYIIIHVFTSLFLFFYSNILLISNNGYYSYITKKK